MTEFNVAEFATAVIAGFACLTVSVAIWFGPGYWALRDAYRRGKNPGVIVLPWLFFGPLSALIWLVIRPSTTLLDQPTEEFTTSDDALSAAARLDRIGEWAAAVRIYENVAKRWLEERDYANNCIDAIRHKETAV